MTLLFGLSALVTSRTTFVVPSAARVVLLIGVVALLLAALSGLAATWPLGYGEPTNRALAALTTGEAWGEDSTQGERAVAAAQVKMIASFRSRNFVKALTLWIAIGAEVLGAVLVAVAVIVVLASD